VGAEALVRLFDDSGRALDTEEVVPVAEATGLVGELGNQVLSRACLDARSWLRQGFDRDMRVNVSAHQLGSVDFVGVVQSTLERMELPPRLLCLELTETAVMAQRQVSTRVLAALREMGVRIAIDDFGTGYSSLAYLQQLPVDHLKIDRSFVSHVDTDHGRRAIVAAMISLAETFGLEVIAEGIETEAEREVLLELGCRRAQGFLFSAPVAFNDMSVGRFQPSEQPLA